MTHSLNFVWQGGASETGLTLLVTVTSSVFVAVGGYTDIATGMTENPYQAGTYSWEGSLPDGQRGCVLFHTGAYAGTPVVKATFSLNPEEGGNLAVTGVDAIAVTFPGENDMQASAWKLLRAIFNRALMMRGQPGS